MPSWFSDRSPPEAPFISFHLLDLKQDQGRLKGLYFDFPVKKHEDSHLYYLRRKQRSFISPSYRTGFVFFATILILSVFSFNAVDAYHLAESRYRLLETQLLAEFDRFSESLIPYRSEKLEPLQDLTPSQAPPQVQIFDHDPLSSVPDSSSLQTPQELGRWRVSLAKGFEAFSSFVQAWPRDDRGSLFSQIKSMRRLAQQALDHWEILLSRPKQADLPVLSPERQQLLLKNLGDLHELSSFLTVFDGSFDEIVKILGFQEPQRIIVLIQDPNQRRATGGALSAGLEILIENGEVLAWRPFHVREYDALLRGNLQPPIGLQQVTDRWTLETANASLDASKSAEQIHWFWQREARSTLDLVVLVSASALEQLLRAYADLGHSESASLPEFGHFELLWSLKSVFGEQDALKSLAGTAIHESLRILRNPDASLELWPTIQRMVSEKQLMIYSSNPDTQAKLEKAGASGSLPTLPHDEDFLMLSSLNLDPAPTDYWINDDYKLHTAIQENGTIKHWLRIERKHSPQDLPEDPSVSEMRNWQSSTHHSLVKVLVPNGSRLISADGISLQDIRSFSSPEGTSWTFPMDIAAHSTETVALSYELPWTFDTSSIDNYRLHWLKQPGTKTARVEHHLKLPAELSIFQQIPEESSLFFHQDRIYAVVAGRNP